MYKTPPADDEKHEQPEITNPTQRRRRATAPKQSAPPPDYYAEEHPEIPRIRRASLYLKPQDPEDELTGSPKNVEAQFIAPSSGKLPTRGKNAPSHSPRSTSNKLQAVPRQRQPIYAPTHTPRPPKRAPRRSRHAHAHSQRLPLNYLQYLTRNQIIIALAILVGIILILAPIISLVSRSSTSTTLSGTSTSTNTNQPPSIQQLPLNPHELVITPEDSDHPAPPIYATAAYLLDADTGATLYAYNPFMHLPMLSTTKLMTAVLAVEHGNPDQKITITPSIENDISKLSADSAMFGIKQGETYTLRDMLYGLLLLSGNDAAVAIADTIGGNIPNFVASMNARGHQLGLNDTHYVNPHGLLKTGQYSSARDLTVLTKYSLSLPLIAQISATKTYYIPQGGNHPARYLINENQFIWWYPGVIGGKTGYAPGDYIQVMSVKRNNHHLIGVVIHTVDWWTDMRNLMNWGFNTFNWVSPRDSDIAHPPIPYDNLWNYFAGDKQQNTIPTASGGRYYIYTGFSISSPIMKYFDKSGGLKKFGYPTAMPKALSSSAISQQFQKTTIQCNLTTSACQTI